MTDEEIAEEYFKTTYPAYIGCDKFTEYIKDAVIYGLKVRTKWHDLRQNPNDLPKRDKRFLSNISISVMTQENNFACYYFDDKKWYSHGVEITPPIAWCEIPQFEEEDVNNEM